MNSFESHGNLEIKIKIKIIIVIVVVIVAVIVVVIAIVIVIVIMIINDYDVHDHDERIHRVFLLKSLKLCHISCSEGPGQTGPERHASGQAGDPGSVET